LERRISKEEATLDDQLNDRMLVARLVEGDRDAPEVFFRRMQNVIWNSCRALTRGEPAAEHVFHYIVYKACLALAEDNFHRLSAYKGRWPLAIDVALAVREILAQRLLRLLSGDEARGWTAFLHFFHESIETWIVKAKILETDRDQAYEFVLAGLQRKNSLKIKKYSGIRRTGDASLFAGYVKAVVKRLILDFLRHKYGRRRLPKPIERLSLLDQLVFVEIYWNGTPPDSGSLLPRLGLLKPPGKSKDEVAAAIEGIRTSDIDQAIIRVSEASPINKPIGGVINTFPRRLGVGRELVDPGPNPEEVLDDNQMEELTKAAYKILAPAIRQLPQSEQILLTQMVDGTRSRRGRPPDASLQRIFDKLVEMTEGDPTVKKWRVAV
jgi:hypothetical protein